MHEWPLVIFTALVIPAAGIFAARQLVDLAGTGAPAGVHGPAVVAAFSLAIGLAASLVHLGRPLRAPRALWRAGRNALSTEVALAVALLLLTLPMVLWPLPPSAVHMLSRAAGVVGVGFLVTLGIVYFLPARWPWRSTLVVTPLLTGVAAGMMLIAVGAAGLGTRAVLVLLAADAVLHAWGWLRGSPAAVPLYPAVFARRHALVALRLLLVNVMPTALAIARLPLAAVVSMLVGILVDRLTFYGAAAQRSPEAEIARVESLIAQRQN